MKRIVTCSDGTWNKPNSSENGRPVRTNVQKIFDYITKEGVFEEKNVKQVKYYDEGVGAEGNIFTRLADGATGKGLDENILHAYKFISWNYEIGDEIFLFGFSRGAYTARSLAGLIRKCGIITKNDLNLFSNAYGLYRDSSLSPESPAVKDFRKQNSYEPKIKFIGVWDTVGSLGLPLHWLQWYNKRKYQFHDTTLSSIIDYAYHAIAVDEKRSTFKPTLWKQSENAKKRSKEQILEQRWFAGVHSNIGGGYPDEGLSDITLKWMLEKAGTAGLCFDESMAEHDVNTNYKGTLYNSKTGLFSFLPSYIRFIDETNAIIDPTVKERIKEVSDYRPVNVKYEKVSG